MRIGRGLSVALLVVATTVSCAQSTGPQPELVSNERCDPMADDVMSGEAVPREDLPGWRQTFVDDFDRCDLGDDWGAYYGQPGGDPASWWEYEQASVTGGALRLRAEQKDGRWVTGGVSNSPVSQRYGKWDVRLRADRSDEISYHILLWPADEVWPPEIDIAESADGTRQTMSSFLHWSGAEGDRHFSQANLQLDTNDWQTVGVEWDPEQIRYLVNGKVWARTPLGASIPDKPMWLGIQAQAGACTKLESWGVGECGLAGTPDVANVDVDWVSVYESDGTPSVVEDTPSGSVMLEQQN
ncbi:glycoside hydrolase family 16 protein [Rhodococcus fascians]|nr:glycoside hydrolase family 16 protein [Rhodococcus fascians]MBY3824161.1 glycoside hydrolase family 16 protein [Rhodococcus fascians]MBY3834683.1 glycoside hydrolase family 16 protein [Rhodococcus fascians]MBY3863895.1 glycoside hydrolase family 16 protein [Rhodococcus fascians]MBY3883366.1 glycoside hydrolase family 16 protein [Rhodococcus fascians]